MKLKDIKEIKKFKKKTSLKTVLLGTKICAGFPSPAQDYIEDVLDLNEFLINHKAATYFVKVDGYSMVNAGINPDDILIVDRAIEPANNKIVIAIIDGELTVKRLIITQDKWYLEPANSEFKTIEINDRMDFKIWGVVTYVIHKAV